MSTETSDSERIKEARLAAEQLKNEQAAAEGAEPESAASATDSELESLQRALQEAQEQIKTLNDKNLRLAADMDNVRRRATKDVENAHKYGSEKFARELLEVVDSLERGMEAIEVGEDEKLKAIFEGMEMTQKILISTLDKFGIKQINPLGEKFDPQQHEALSMAPSPDHEPNSVMQVIQCGYSIYDRVLRPARVIVAKNP